MNNPTMAGHKKTNYESALDEARARLSGIDPAVQAGRLGGTAIRRDGAADLIQLRFMGDDHLVSIPEGEVSRPDGADVPVFRQILILHALLFCTGNPPSGRWIAFSDIPDGLLYAAVYERRTALRLARALSGKGGRLIDAADRLGGRRSALGGDISIVVEPFNGIPVGIVFWEADDDFGPAVTFLYDETITDIFPAEDIVVMTQCLVEEIIGIVREELP